MPDPEDKTGEETQAEEKKVEVLAAELERLQKIANREGYQGRQWEKRFQELEGKYQELLGAKDNPPSDDEEAKSQHFTRMKAMHEESQHIKREKEQLEALKRENFALTMTEKYGIPTADLAGCESEDKMELAALRYANSLKGAPAKAGIDTGTGRSGGGTGRKPSLEEVQNASPEVFNAKVTSGEWVLR